MTIQAIETKYSGHRFRSRLEARWAKFMTVAGVTWAYEPEGYSFDGIYYLPDFRLDRMWLEIKPFAVVPAHELAKVEGFQIALREPGAKVAPRTIHILAGNCGVGEYSFPTSSCEWFGL
jgi:hypothetical protein